MSRIVTVGLTTLPPSMSRLSRQCGILNISESYRPPRPVTGIALLCFNIAQSQNFSVYILSSKKNLFSCKLIPTERKVGNATSKK
jgi:hypothetical protein